MMVPFNASFISLWHLRSVNGRCAIKSTVDGNRVEAGKTGEAWTIVVSSETILCAAGNGGDDDVADEG